VDVTELAPGVHGLTQRKGGHVYAFLLDDDDASLTLIDTLYDTDGGRVLVQLERMGRLAEDLTQNVITHAHRSHLGGLQTLRERTSARVYAHEWEADIVRGERIAQPVSIVPKRPLRAYYPFQFGAALGLGKHPPCQVDEYIHEGDRIGPLHVVHAPGHTPGHLAFYWPERRVLFCGDAVVTWPRFEAGWPAFRLNPKQHEASLRRMAELDVDIVGVGHGEPIRAQASRRLRALVDRLGR
jgi:glyoxylase-like metal-dependent hydrolase (beta-lactamase superfamily II)